jgi:hypothetical protein
MALVHTVACRSYPTSSNNADEAVAAPPAYSARCILSYSLLHELHLAPGDPAVLHTAVDTGKPAVACLCTCWPSSAIRAHSNVLIDCRTVITGTSLAAQALQATPLLTASRSDATVLVPLPIAGVRVASSLLIALSVSGLSSGPLTPPIDLSCPRLTAMVKRSLRQLCVCEGAVIAVPLGSGSSSSSSVISATVLSATPRGCSAWWVTLSTMITAETVEHTAIAAAPAAAAAAAAVESAEGAAGSTESVQPKGVPCTTSSAVADLLLELILLPAVAPSMAPFIPRYVETAIAATAIHLLQCCNTVCKAGMQLNAAS